MEGETQQAWVRISRLPFPASASLRGGGEGEIGRPPSQPSVCVTHHNCSIQLMLAYQAAFSLKNAWTFIRRPLLIFGQQCTSTCLPRGRLDVYQHTLQRVDSTLTAQEQGGLHRRPVRIGAVRVSNLLDRRVTSSRFNVHVKLFSREMPLQGKDAEQGRKGSKGRRFRRASNRGKWRYEKCWVPRQPSCVRLNCNLSRALLFYIFRECLKGVR